MNRKNILIIVGIIIVVVAGFLFSRQKPADRILGYTLQDNVLSIASNSLTKAEVWGVSSATSTPGKRVKVADMELVESSASGQQTWVYVVPNKAIPLKEVYVRGYDEKNKEVKQFVILKTAEEVTQSFWSPAQPAEGLEGTINSITPASRVVVVHIKEGNVSVTLTPNARVLNEKGQAVNFSTLKKGMKVIVAGDYVDEGLFSGTQIEITK